MCYTIHTSDILIFRPLGVGDHVAITVLDGNVNKEVPGKCKSALTHNDLKAAPARCGYLKRKCKIWPIQIRKELKKRPG